MKPLIASLLCLSVVACHAAAPEQAVRAVVLHVPVHPRLATCLRVTGRDPSKQLLHALRAERKHLFAGSTCSWRRGLVVTASGMPAEFQDFGPFTRTGPWSATLRVDTASSPLSGSVWLYKLKLLDGQWVVDSEQIVSMS